ncbi:motility protein A [Defluviitalea phaphyphila]|uniref:motility protein A n=1 Tax=Defluviitalea phaphyphila TaxID=1473580 RepID=UPI00072FA31F|nr:MotA/TolQ/ExbB proton channel family protein [Defluviitalea phaphyphila]
MDLSTIIGIISGIIFVVLSIMLKGRLGLFADISSVMITIGGTFASVLISYPLNKFINSIKTMGLIFKNKELNAGEVIKQIIDLANIARKEGLLALEEAAQEMEDKFLQKGILLIVDGTDPELVRNIMETELAFVEARHKETQGFWETIAKLGPAWGMIGTLIGLIIMLDQLDDPTKIGPAMAVALLTTFYGSILANLLASPTANKLKVRSSEEILLKEVMIEGLLSIQAGENPRIIEEKLKAFLSPTLRNSMEEKEEEKVVEVGE